MTKYTTVLAGLLSHLSGSDFKKAVKDHQADNSNSEFKKIAEN
jgi:hypothetical protein